jgi:LacI family transcriptional regulator
LGRSDTIGLVIPDIANPFFAKLAASVEDTAQSLGLSVSLCASLNRRERELAYLDQLRRNHVDGLIFVTNHGDDGTLAERINAVERVVILDEDVPRSMAPKVFCDNDAGGYLAGRHLVETGHRDIAFIGGGVDMLSTRERSRGLQRALSEGGPDCRIATQYHGEYTIDYGRAAAREFLASRERATAIFAGSDEIAIGLLEALRDAGLTVPDAVSVIGFDDVAPLHLFSPPLTAIRQPVAAIGRRGVELLMMRNAQDPQGSTVEHLPVEIVVRSSVATPAKGAQRGQRVKRERAL